MSLLPHISIDFVMRVNEDHIDIQHDGLIAQNVQGFRYFALKETTSVEKNISEFAKKNNGITISDQPDSLQIYNDPFSTIPLYIAKANNNEIVVWSNFEHVYTLRTPSFTIDKVGFWEILLFEAGVGTRTLFKEVKQLPSASFITINKRKGEYSIDRYWDFNIAEETSITSLTEAAQGLHERLDTVFKALDDSQQYLLGVSGGMDSRLTLAYLNKHLPKEHVHTFTFGYDARVLDYEYAKNVCKVLGRSMPDFYEITDKVYQESID